ncbi:hypothetical protein ACFPM0_33715 [Pseudonocardia sulfidoxydans]
MALVGVIDAVMLTAHPPPDPTAAPNSHVRPQWTNGRTRDDR